MQPAVIKEIVQASNRMTSDEQLSLTFIQIGNDRAATTFLNFLDNNLRPQGARFGILFYFTSPFYVHSFIILFFFFFDMCRYCGHSIHRGIGPNDL